MSLKLYLHPLSSYCWKALLALYENATPFESVLIDLRDPAMRAEVASLWPFTKFPVLRDEARDETVPESTIIIEYIAQHYPGRAELVPQGRDDARNVRFCDRFFDLYVHSPVQTIVGDRNRPPGSKDPYGVEQARETLRTAYDRIEREMATKRFAASDTLSMADCAAGPALYYANRVLPFGGTLPNTTAYLERLLDRPAFRRVMSEAEPYFPMFPG